MLLMALLVPWAANAQGTLTVCEGTTQNQLIPIYAYSGDTQGTTSEFIIPASTLTELNGKEVTALKFYLAQSQSKTWTANYQIYMAVVDYTTLSSNIGPDAGTIVYEGTVDASGSEMTITFNQGNYTYNGGNLLIGSYVETEGAWDSNGKFYGIEAEDAAYLSGDWGGYSTGPQDFIPQTTFIYLTDDPYITLDPTSATVFTGATATLTASYGNVTGTPTITYSSSNPKIASVSGSGTSATVTGESVGTATITATMTYNATEYTATCAVTVEEPSYCKPSFSNNSDYIKSFTTTGGEQNIDNQNTGQGTGGYSNFYDTHFVSAEPDTEIGFSVVRGYPDTYQYGLWVDWNKDYEFDNATELVASTTSAQDWSSSFTIPASTPAGDYHMRILQLYGSSNTLTACASASYGEGEDYKLTVTAANPYQKPVDLTIIDVDAHTATIGWTAPNTNVQSYKYQYKEEGGEWTALQSTTATEAPLTGLTAEKHHIFQVQAIYAGGNESAFASIEFDTEIACAAPTNLAASNITDEGATLSWDGSASSYNVRYRTQRGFHYDFEQAEVWTYDNFPPCTTYDGDGVQCYGFSGETFTNFPFTGSTFAFGSQSGNLSSHSGNVFGLMVCPADASQADDWFILPAITIENGYVFQFYAREITNQYGDETINVGIYGDTPGTFAEVIDADVAIGETTYTLHSYDLSAYAGQTIRLAINYVSADIFGFMFDDIFVGNPNDNTWDVTENKVTSPYPIVGLTELTTYDFEVQADCGGGETSSWVATSFTTLPSCMPVSNLAVSDITTTTVGLTWEDNNGGTASYIVTDGDDNPMTVTNLTVTGCTVTGLIANTLYTFKVSADCGSTTVSIQARTECDVITTLPYDEGFETVTYYCWALDGFSGLNNSTYAHTGNMSIYADGSSTDSHHIILPEMGNEISDLMLNFWYYNFNAGIDCGTLYVGYVTDPDDFTTFTEVGYIDMSSGINEYAQSQDFVFTGAPAGSRMAIDYDASGETYAYVMIDDARIDIAPNCVKPYDLLVYDETTHGATFEWTSNGSETEWHLYVSTENNAPADDINLKEVYVADSNPFTLTTGLDPETNYYVWVRASCGGDDGNSSWVGPETFTTEVACPAPTGLAASEITGHTAKLSWNGTSDSYNVRYRTAASVDPVLTEDFENETHYNNNWTVVNLSTANTPGRNSNAGHNSSYGFRFSSYSSASTYEEHLINTNELTGLTSGVIEFYYKKTNSSTETFAVGYSSTDKETTSFSFGANVTATTSWQLFHEEIPAGTKYVSIKYTTTGCYYYIYIDDIVIGNVIPAGTWQTVNPAPDSSPCTISDLSAETKYEAQVQGNCGGEGTSQWSNIFSFTTDIACYPATGLAYDNLKSNRVDLTWTSEADAWVFAYKLATDADFTEIALTSSDVTIEGTTVTYQLTGLTAEKEYAVKVRNNCGGGDLSAWTNVITFETLAACAQPTDVTVSNIGHYTADVAWTGDSEYYILQYRTAAYIDGIGEEFSGTSVPTDWTLYTGMVDNVIAGTATLASTNYGWTMTTSTPNVFNSNHIRLNIYGTSRNHWLVTPEIDLAENSGLSFDLALTAYSSNGTSTSAASGNCDDERFVVLIYANDAWSILREWNNSGSSDVYNDIATAGENVQIDLSSYSGTVKIAFYGESTTSGNGDNDMHLDNVSFGTIVPAGSWQTLSPNPTTTAANLSGLSVGTKYDVRVAPSCDATLVSDAATFTTLADMIFITEGEWGNATNWLDNLMPTIDDNVQLQANATIASTDVAEADKITLNGKTLTINDGGQLKINNSVTATVKKNISHYNYSGDPVDPEHPADGYNLIANPVGTIYSYNVSSTGMLAGTYDLYNWIYSNDHEWQNFRNTTFALYNGTGYLYANSDDVELTFAGSIKANNVDEVKALNYASTNYEFNGWNLVGNPFMCNAYITNVNGEVAFYRMNENGDGFVTATGAIAPMEGIFVQATASGQSFTFTRTNPDTDNGTGNLNISVAQNVNSRDAHASTDNAIVRFGNANTLEKFSLRENSTKMYIPQDSKKYAVVSAEASGTLPLNLKVEKTGSYTISFSNEDVEFTYLHLIDGITGEDIDLLVEDSYTFNASVRDRENRFTLVFNSIDSNIDATSDIFVYQNDDQIVVSGEGELQVYDVMGRYVGSYDVNGTETLNASQFANNVYIFRLVGETVKTQKIVVR